MESRKINIPLVGGVALVVLFLFGLPVVGVFFQGLSRGVDAFVTSLGARDTVAAIQLTLIVVGLAVPLNVAFGLAASWAIARFDFPGKRVLVTFIELPLSMSPVISGLVFVLLFGARGVLGPWLGDNEIRIIYATPGLVIATVLVTLPLVARELIPVMQSRGTDDEHAALTLGASGLAMFWRVTLPNIKWGLLHGTVLCAARGLGEFGAVSVVSGRVRGATQTMPLQIEALYNDYDFASAFTLAAVLAMMTGFAVLIKRWIEVVQAKSLKGQ
jgi:sulfate transport system permease protein